MSDENRATRTKLTLDDLKVESFETVPQRPLAPSGTVRGYETIGDPTCDASCGACDETHDANLCTMICSMEVGQCSMDGSCSDNPPCEPTSVPLFC
jgi:hypothetical protein